MSTSVLTAAPPPAIAPAPHRRRIPFRRIAVTLLVLAALAGVVWMGVRAWRKVAIAGASPIPVTRVRRGEVTFTVHANGALSGGNSEALAAPMTGGGTLHITYLRKPGELVAAGDRVVEFDTTEQQFNLREAEADVAEAEQRVAQAKAQLEAQQEEDNYALEKARSDVRLAELEAQKNAISAAITARENDMALAEARETLAETEKNLANRKSTNEAGIVAQEAARAKAQVQAAAARRNIEAMTLTAHRAGYVAIRLNTNLNFFIDGMTLSPFQLGDEVRPGMTVAELPDLNNWEVTAQIAEVDRGHIAIGQQTEIRVIALPGQRFRGRVKDLGGTTGSPWDRHFDCHIALDHPAPELRPGMSVRVAITTDSIRDALWLPAQALFEADGRTYVYVPSGSGFAPRDVKLIRRSESQVVIAGLAERQAVALADPTRQAKKNDGSTSASQAIRK
jgi:macrolide-specific efflux system membrane fusion protein